MRVHLDQIGPEGYDLDEPMTEAWLAETLGKDSPFRPHGKGHLRAHLDRLDGGVVLVHGRASLEVDAPCARCLETVSLNLDTDLDVTLFPVGKEPEAGTGGEVGDDDIGIGSYAESEIDLANIIRDEVFLGLPMIPLCREQCRGLCPSCGENLNRKQCACKPVKDGRFDALLKFKTK